jgi:broad specificity phosphatase PhoE
MKIILIRHGQTDWNIEGKVQSITDIPLNETGLQQAYKAKEILTDYSFEKAIVSPLIRARQTAQIVCAGRNIDITYDERIKERNFGRFEGLSYKGNVEYRTGAWTLEEAHKLDTVEPYNEFYRRIADFLNDLYSTHPDKSILLVAHGGVSIAVAHYFKGIPKSGCLHEYILDNCAVAEYDFDAEYGKE